jgi:formylmethanofuran dehydrogenase subunit C
VTGLRFTLRGEPDQRLDLSPLTPDRLAGLDHRTIEHIVLSTTRTQLCVGDVFTLQDGEADAVVIEGGSSRLDRVGEAMAGGTLVVDGDAGQRCGRLMQAGRLEVRGNAGGWAASRLRGGSFVVLGNVGERLGGPLAGELVGMTGGSVVVRGSAGDRPGDRLRRGMIVVEGDAGASPGSRMIAGSLIVCGASGALPGYLMRRGSIVIGRPGRLPPGFVAVGGETPVFTRLLERTARAISEPAAACVAAATHRLAGDMAALGLGELFIPRGQT